MELNKEDFITINGAYIELCRKYGINPSVLKDIIFFRSKGYNNTKVAERIGVHRVTVQNYVEKLRNMENEDFGTAIMGISTIIKNTHFIQDEIYNNEI